MSAEILKFCQIQNQQVSKSICRDIVQTVPMELSLKIQKFDKILN